MSDYSYIIDIQSNIRLLTIVNNSCENCVNKNGSNYLVIMGHDEYICIT